MIVPIYIYSPNCSQLYVDPVISFCTVVMNFNLFLG